MNILFQNRQNVYQKPGGDTVVMNNLGKQLELLGHNVQFSSDSSSNLSDIDIVHVFNLTLPSVTDAFAQNAKKQNKPFVATTLQENFAVYLNKALATIKIFQKYIDKKQNKNFFNDIFHLLYTVPPANIVTAPFTLAFSDKLFSCGETESSFIKNLFPRAKVEAVHFGSRIKEADASSSLFEKDFGVKDFVLCVARLEARKNQLMLLKALEDEDVPLVFVDGGFTYQEEYKKLCMNYKRKGKTIFTGRLSDEQLVSAYRAARVHCLPSWYELPGLVTLEAARYGCQVIASSWGAITDYMNNACTYCEPDDYISIRDAILKTYNTGKNDSAMKQSEKYTWENMAIMTLTLYEKIFT